LQLVLLYRDLSGVLFFFSSRRRHTRSDRDWSSDVCSSDLSACIRSICSLFLRSSSSRLLAAESSSLSFSERAPDSARRAANSRSRSETCLLRISLANRSEERRVGKECWSRWSPAE